MKRRTNGRTVVGHHPTDHTDRRPQSVSAAGFWLGSSEEPVIMSFRISPHPPGRILNFEF
jgi:hypothetical protein